MIPILKKLILIFGTWLLQLRIFLLLIRLVNLDRVKKYIIMTIYRRDFFESHNSGTKGSAQEIVPYIIKFLNPKSVLDVGCGTGIWLAVFNKLGVNDFVGIDGD